MSVRSQLVIGIVTGIVATVLGGLLLLWLTPIAPGIWRGIAGGAGAFVDYLSANAGMPRWLLMLLLGAVAWSLLSAVRRTFSRSTPALALNPTVYRKDSFFGVIWRWDYYGNMIGDPHPYCPRDETPLVARPDEHNWHLEFVCETCQERFEIPGGHVEKAQGMVQRQIERKHRTGEWQDIVMSPDRKLRTG